MKVAKAFDIYRKVPRDLTEPTLSGAAVSCCTVTLAVYLFFSELSVFMRRTWKSEMVLDESRTEEKLQINLNITLPAMPCELLSFDAQDVMGSHEVDAHGHLFKDRLTSKGDVIATEEMKGSHYGASSTLTRHFSFSYDNQDVDRIRKMINSGEGCRVAGYVKVNKVPGNVHLSTYSHSYLFGSLYQETRKINVSHIINHISFGTDRDIDYVQTNYKGTGHVTPLDGVSAIVGEKKEGGGIDSAIFEYYTKVVPTTYRPLDKDQLSVYQFTANSNRIVNQQMPSLYLRYDFSPVTVLYTEQRESTSHFLVQICAVIGGVFTVAGLLDSFIHKSIVAIAKKAQLGKIN
mmetsp:Transcript_28622/g.46050  ORF Transcript_28622/g.46050 Transcript_28622/m.46050 type:complete len:347 (+) Transcript_28622:126-1166(+)|eukprot:CAMPEP_0169131954 /NCGR_PEP_ID=MMETSP1015-20121227/38531_1 /TAXON_ID=342587 /ORGANISM="Karlodinium micrum, Strain CCMP2283" /LENGTH=346 /DNA_ID=CAMNT_0009196267 /DNA_START=124 /DNA_END=1164 /DNA_ORIENTATION=-